MSDKIEKLRKQYENIQASEELIMKAEKEIRKSKSKRGFKAGIGTAAAFIFAVGVAANASPSFAYAMSDVPVMGSIVKVVTLGKYENKDGGYEIKVNTPQIEGLIDEETQEKLNEVFKDQAQSVIAAFEQDVKELKEEFGDETVHMGIEYNYDIKTNTDDILAIDTYTFFASGSSNSVHNYYTIDKHTGEIYTLEGLFKDGADYVTPISDYIKKEMARRNAEEGGMFWVEDDEYVEGFDKIADDQNFYINADGNIVICFAKYEVAAGAQGVPEFVIPDEVVADIIK